MRKSFSISSNSSSILRASLSSYYHSENKLDSKSPSQDVSLTSSIKEVLSEPDENLRRQRDSLLLQSFREQDIYQSTFDFSLEESEELPISAEEVSEVSQTVQKLIYHLETFADTLKAFKKQFLVLLSTIKFSQPHLYTFLVETLAKDTFQLLDAESYLVVELNGLDICEDKLAFGSIYKSWTRHIKHYVIASQHALVAREILRKEALNNERLKIIIAKPFSGYRTPILFLEALAKRLDFHRTHINRISLALPNEHPEKKNLDQFSEKIQEILDMNELSSVLFEKTPGHTVRNSEDTGRLSIKDMSIGSGKGPSSILFSQEVLEPESSFSEQPNFKRLEPLEELILTEESYLKDLMVIEELLIPTVKEACILEERSPDLIINNLFYNYKSLINLSHQLLAGLVHRRKEQPSLDRIGDIMLDFTTGLHSFGDFGSHAQFSMRFWVNEKINDTFLARCLKQAEEDNRSEKKALNTFLARPTYRLGQYPMLLRQILKHTPSDSEEASDIIESLVRIESCLGVLNDLTDKEERRLQLRELQDRMFYKSGGIGQFGLADDGREIIHEGNLLKPPFGQRLKLFLFDHALLITRPRKVKSTDLNEYDLVKKPIPLDELYLEESSGLIKLALTKAQIEQSFTVVKVSRDKMEKISILTSCNAEKNIWIEKINTQREKFMAQKGLAKYSFS